jgi:hypothetical protein
MNPTPIDLRAGPVASRLSGCRLCVAVAALLGAVSIAASADSISYFDDIPADNQDLDSVLGTFGLYDRGSETDGQSFIVPDANGDGSPVTITTSFVDDTGNFLFTFGAVPVAAVVGMDAPSNRFAWTLAALTHPQTLAVFDDRDIDPCLDPAALNDSCQARFPGIPVGSEWFFFLIPNNTLQAFRDDPSGFYHNTRDDCGEYGTYCRNPLFSFTPANPGGFDQMLSFTGNGETLFAFEDLSRQGYSDQDFSDLVFVLDFENSAETFTPNESQETRDRIPSVPAPSSPGLMLLGLLVYAWRRSWRPSLRATSVRA